MEHHPKSAVLVKFLPRCGIPDKIMLFEQLQQMKPMLGDIIYSYEPAGQWYDAFVEDQS